VADQQDGRLFDVGAQAERTAMAWQRTALGLVAVAALTVRWSVTENLPVLPGIALAVAGGLAGLVVVRQRYLRVLRTVPHGQTPVSRYLIPASTVFMVAVTVGIAVGVAVEFSRF
jgi:uncharacterized membrane protein YidH (DUF202 family)